MRFAGALLLIVFVAVGQCTAADGENESRPWNISASFDFASAYIFRGATFNDGCVFQPGLEASLYFLTIGAWANYDVYDYNGALDEYNFSEKNFYAMLRFKLLGADIETGYRMYVDKRVYVIPSYKDVVYNTRAEAEAAHDEAVERKQSYPGPEFEIDDAGEASFSVKYPAKLTPSLAVYWGTDGCLEDYLNIVAGLNYEYYNRDGWRMGAGLSATYLDQPDGGRDGISYYLLEHTVNYKIVTIRIRYIGIVDHEILGDANNGGGIDIREYGSVGFSYKF